MPAALRGLRTPGHPGRAAAVQKALPRNPQHPPPRRKWQTGGRKSGGQRLACQRVPGSLGTLRDRAGRLAARRRRRQPGRKRLGGLRLGRLAHQQVVPRALQQPLAARPARHGCPLQRSCRVSVKGPRPSTSSHALSSSRWLRAAQHGTGARVSKGQVRASQARPDHGQRAYIDSWWQPLPAAALPMASNHPPNECGSHHSTRRFLRRLHLRHWPPSCAAHL